MEALAVGRYLNVFGSPPLNAGTPIWRDQPLKGKTLLFRCEGGLGDQICNVRFAPAFKERGAKVIVACDRGLWPLFEGLATIDTLIDSEHPESARHDYWMPAMSAALALGIEYDTLDGEAYLPRPNPIHMPGSFRIGLRWAGNPKFEDEQRRRFDPGLMLGLSDIPGATFYSLQRDDGVCALPKNVTDLAPFLKTWRDTAQFIASMDLVISSCTAVAHLAAAMGVPTWIVVPVLPYYLWALQGETSPWYDSVILFRQTKFNEWEQPFARIRARLRTTYCDMAA